MAKKNALKIAAVGEDFGAVLRAQDLSQRLADELEPEFEVNSDTWKFESLSNFQEWKEASKGAAQADMVIIAASGTAEPPAHVKGWIESWLPRKRKGVTALVALLDHEGEALHESSPLCAYLRQLAGNWNMDFFSNSGDWQQRYLESKVEAPSCQPEMA